MSLFKLYIITPNLFNLKNHLLYISYNIYDIINGKNDGDVDDLWEFDLISEHNAEAMHLP